jgi:hypothetical protein
MFPSFSLEKLPKNKNPTYSIIPAVGFTYSSKLRKNPKSRASLRQTAAFDNTDNMSVRRSFE